ncbi:MAG: FAD-dependent oxidoreductase [Terriglobia bacterium]
MKPTGRDGDEKSSFDPEGVLAAQWGDYGLPPAESSFAVHAIIAAHYFEGVSFPVGGASSFAAGIAPVIESAGGQIVFSAEVREILLDRAQRAVGVRMQDGRELRADTVISDAGAWNTFASLLPEEAPGVAPALAELRALPPSMAHLCLYAGVKQSAEELGLTGTNLWIHPTPDHDANLARFVSDPSAPLPVLFISSPSAKDPDFERRHPGRATLEVICPAPYDWFALGRYSLEAAGTGLRRLQTATDGAPAERFGRACAGRAREAGHRGALDATIDPPLYELPARRSLRSQRHPRALSPSLPYPPHLRAQPLPHGPGRLSVRRNRSADGWGADGLRRAGAKPGVSSLQTGLDRVRGSPRNEWRSSFLKPLS